jgi:hypothetical protein
MVVAVTNRLLSLPLANAYRGSSRDQKLVPPLRALRKSCITGQ